MNKGLIVHALIFDSEHRVLILKRTPKTDTLPGFWDIPGGTLKDGEDPIEGVIRETKEETNLDIKNSGLFFYTSNVDEEKDTQFVRLVFLVKAPSSPDVKIFPEEHVEHKWVKMSEAMQYKLVDYLPRCFQILKTKEHSLFKF